jgi:S1-C subfamily serine protease
VAGKGAGRPQWVLAALGLGAAGVLAAGAAIWGLVAREQATRAALVEAKAESAAAMSAVIRPETLSEAEKAVFKVNLKGGGHGTAFVIDRENGVLATAAHVAQLFDENDPNLSVVNRYSGGPVRVKAIKVHRGYGELNRVVHDYGPVDPAASIFLPRLAQISSNPLDVALLFVDPIDEETGESRLPAELKIASEASIYGLKGGDVVAIIGFPGDAVTDGLGPESASSRVERGVVGALISPIDHRAYADDPKTNYLVATRIDFVGGNSGGPLINAAGEVVGVTTSGTRRDGVSQRADILMDLLDPLREARRLAEVYRPDWRRRLEQWPRAEALLPHAFYLRWKRGALKDPQDPPPKMLGEIDIEVERPFAVSTVTLALGEPAQRFIARTPDLEPKASAAQKPTAPQSQPIRAVLFDQPGQYAAARIELSPDRTHGVYVWDAGLVFGSGECVAELYLRRVGDQAFRGPSNAAPAAIVVRESDQKGLSASFDAVIRRKACYQTSQDIRLGVVSWTDGKPAPRGASIIQVASNAGLTGSAVASEAATMTPTVVAETRERRPIGCLLPGRAQDYACAKPAHAVAVGGDAFMIDGGGERR